MLGIIKKNKNYVIQYGSLILVIIGSYIGTEGRIVSAYNIKTLVSITVPILILSVGLLFVFAHGNKDVASGKVIGLCSLITVNIMNVMGCTQLSVWVCLAINILVVILIYWLIIYCAIKFKMMAIISSLSVMFICSGIVGAIINPTPTGYMKVEDFSALSIFNELWFQIICVAVVILFAFVIFQYTRIGKQAKAIGDNPLAARQSGTNVNKVMFICYTIAGACVGLASMFMLAYLGGSSTIGIGAGYEMRVMISLILGGMILTGGSKSSISYAVIGSITYSIIYQALSLVNLVNYISLANGIIFLIIVTITIRVPVSQRQMPR